MATAVACVAALLLLGAPHAAGAAGTWTVQAVPPPATPDQALLGVSCPSQTWCMAVGSSVGYCDYAAAVCLHFGHAFSEEWNGAVWNPVAVGGSTARESLVAVSCPTQSACLAVGWQRVGKVLTALVERWDGARWAVLPLPRALGRSAFASVSCAAADACMAVGRGSGTRGGTALAAHWNGHRLTVRAAPGSGLNAVSCPNAHSCYAAGHGDVIGGCAGVTIEHWRPGQWTVDYRVATGCSGGVTPDYASAIVGVSCPSNGFCMGVGWECCGDFGPYAFVVKWTPARASASVPALDPAAYVPGDGDALAGIACSSPTACAAVGTSNSTFGNPDPLRGSVAATYDGRRWVRVPSPTPGGVGGDLAAVACPTPSACVAVGSYVGTTLAPLIESTIAGSGP